jgi:hypothetical protein
VEGHDVGIVQQSVALHLGDHLLISLYGTASNLKGMLIRHLGLHGSRLQSGVTLSELYSDYTELWKGLLGALGSKVDTCFNAAVTTLCELVAAVDPLPGREPAVQAAISGKVSCSISKSATSERSILLKEV